MKNCIIVLILFLSPIVMFGQEEFNKFQDTDGIETVVVNGKMLDIFSDIEFSGDASQASAYLKKVKEMKSLKIFTTKVSEHMKEMRNTLASYLKKYKMEELVSVNEGKSKVKIYLKTGERASKINELLLFTEADGGEGTTLISFVGDIDLNGKLE